MTPPLVSIIIPAYNAEQWIAQSVASATRQTWKNVEIIVVNDGSSDRTEEIAGSTRDVRVTLVSQKNAGAAAARNRGLRESRGDFVQYLDADDVLGDDKVERQLNALSSSPASSVASCAWLRFSHEISAAEPLPEPVWTVADPVEWLVGSLGGGGMMQPGAWLTPRAVADAAGPWNESLTLHDDGEYFTRVLLASTRNVFVPEARVYYRDVEESLSRRRSRHAIESAFAVCKARARHLLAVKDSREVRRALATQYAQFAYENALSAPDLVGESLAAIEELGVSPNHTVGGGLFTLLDRIVGFPAAIHLRQSLREKRDTPLE